MTLDLSVSTLISFTATLSFLGWYSILDLRTRIVPNSHMAIGLVAAVVIIILSGHFLNAPMLHMSAILFAVPVSYLLYRLGAFGGADFKSICMIAIMSPGVELMQSFNPVIEAVLASGIQMVTMLIAGVLFFRITKRGQEKIPPLIPVLLLTYLLIQVAAIVW